MGYKTKIQLIDRGESRQYYVNMPSAIAQAMNFKKGECFEWSIVDKNTLTLRRCGRQSDGILH